MKKEKIGFIKRLSLVMAIILVSLILGVNFWFLFLAGGLFVLLRYIGVKFISNVVVLLALVIVAPIALEAFFPRTNSSMKSARARLDQIISYKLPDDGEVRLAEIFRQERRLAQEEFTLMYQSMLKNGQTEEANDSLMAFREKWGILKDEAFDSIDEVYERVELISVSDRDDMLDDLAGSSEESSAERTYMMGDYNIVVNGETPYYIVIHFKEDVRKGIKLTSKENNFTIIFEDGKVFNAFAALPYRDVYKFKIATSQEREVVSLKIY